MSTAIKKKKKKKQKSHGIAFYLIITMCVLLAIGAAALGGFYYWLSPYKDYPYILPNVSYAGISLEGLTRDEATKAITIDLARRDYAVTVAFPDGNEYQLDPKQEVHEADIQGAVDKAFAYGRVNTQPMMMYNAIKAARGAAYEVPSSLSISYDKDDLRSQVDAMVEDLYIAPGSAEGTGDAEAKTVSVTPGTPGRTADADLLYAAACQAFDSFQFGTIQADYEIIPLNEEQLTGLVTALQNQYSVEVTETSVKLDEMAHAADITKGIPGFSLDTTALVDEITKRTAEGNYETYTVSLTEVLPTAVDVAMIFTSLRIDPTPVEYHDGHLTGGDPGYEIDGENAKTQFDALDWGENIRLEMDEIPPEHTLEEVQDRLFADVLGSYSTNHTGEYGRTTNLRLACQEIDGIVLNAGATFSFNTFVGERTPEKGYQKAIVYADGEVEADDGGGVCQVASTIYNAALYAEMDVTDRMEHRYLVTYVPGGLDATVYWGVQDFCFVNTTEYPIQIHASVSGGQVHISIYGTDDYGHSVRLSSSVVSSDSEYITYEAYQDIYDSYGDLIESVNLGTSTYERH